MQENDTDAHPAGTQRLRLDKWLWAARFFKTRSLAKAAIEAGHVRCSGERCKVSKEVGPGMVLSIRQGWDEVEVTVRAIGEQRRGAPEARTLYAETAESVRQREQARLARQSQPQIDNAQGRPHKHARRALEKFKRQLGYD